MKKNHSISLALSQRSKSQKRSSRNVSAINVPTLRGSVDTFPSLSKLQLENLELRKKLKQFNESLNFIIEKTHSKAQTKSNSETNPEETLETVRKRLKYYE
jgi:hypothetical protein